MKKEMMSLFQRILFIALLLPILTVARSQGIEFFHGSWEEALIEAEKQNKIIFVDCYTTWCGPCKRMARDVFPNEEVGAYYNKNFINVKMDMEKGEGPAFGRKYPVAAYPTLYFIKPDGETITAHRGARGVKDFIALGASVIKKFDFSADYKTAYEKGNREPELILNYVKALNQSNKSSLKVVNDYLREEPDLGDSVTMAIILEGSTEADSKPYSILTSSKKQFEKAFGEQVVRETIISACRSTAEKALEFEYYELVDLAVSEMDKHAPKVNKEFSYTAPMNYYQGMSDWDSYYPVAQEYVKKVVRKDANGLTELSETIQDYFSYEPDAVNYAGELLEEAAKYGDNWSCDLELAKYYYKQKDLKAARKAAKKALAKAKKEDAPTAEIENFMKVLDGKIQIFDK